MGKSIRNGLWPALLDILFPERCLACGTGMKSHENISYCASCRQEIRLICEPFCITCGKPFDQAGGANHLCGFCLINDWHFQQARAAVGYRSPVTEAVKTFKYGGKMYGLATFAALAQQYLLAQPLPDPDVIVPVPLHNKRLRQRGFNQAFILSKKIFPEWKHKIDPHILFRHQWSRPQTSLTGAERRRNVKNAFKVGRPDKIKNKKVLLVDDVFTTGATVNECARVLMGSHASEVVVFTFARAIVG
ncbi:MAG: ComF family protein [Desulfobulbales bacterium]|nr:ComF family protein [Desulfobulbales bacterium]